MLYGLTECKRVDGNYFVSDELTIDLVFDEEVLMVVGCWLMVDGSCHLTPET